MRLIKGIFIVTGLFVLASCSSISSKDDCVEADWYDVGYEDALDGKRVTQLNEYRATCSEYKVKVNAKHYRGGWNNAIQTVCNYDKGFKTGFEKRRMVDNCPPRLVSAYRKGFREGEKEFARQEEAKRLEKRQKELEQIEKSLETE